MNINSPYCYYSIHIPPVTLSEKRDKIPHKGVTKWVPFPLYPYPSKAENRPFSKIMSHFEICMSLIMRRIIFRCDVTLILNFLTRATLQGYAIVVALPRYTYAKQAFHIVIQILISLLLGNKYYVSYQQNSDTMYFFIHHHLKNKRKLYDIAI